MEGEWYEARAEVDGELQVIAKAERKMDACQAAREALLSLSEKGVSTFQLWCLAPGKTDEREGTYFIS